LTTENATPEVQDLVPLIEEVKKLGGEVEAKRAMAAAATSDHTEALIRYDKAYKALVDAVNRKIAVPSEPIPDRLRRNLGLAPGPGVGDDRGDSA
jgi:phosphoenolpyruvate carboxylase